MPGPSTRWTDQTKKRLVEAGISHHKETTIDSPLEVTVSAGEAGSSIDLALFHLLPIDRLTRARVKRAVKDGRVTINGRITRNTRICVRKSDVITFMDAKRETPGFVEPETIPPPAVTAASMEDQRSMSRNPQTKAGEKKPQRLQAEQPGEDSGGEDQDLASPLHDQPARRLQARVEKLLPLPTQAVAAETIRKFVEKVVLLQPAL